MKTFRVTYASSWSSVTVQITARTIEDALDIGETDRAWFYRDCVVVGWEQVK